jgi:GNAT superfamily N-acetyltransferase
VIFAALSEAAGKGELLLVAGGMCRFHRRRDGTVTIREILVLPGSRRQGIGRRLIELVRLRCPGATLKARCPVRSEGNFFWRVLGFVLVETRDDLNLWRLDPCA